MIRRSVFVYIAVVILFFGGIVLPEILAATRSDYSSLANYISELGVNGTSTQRFTHTLAFPLVGIGGTSILLALWRRLPATHPIRAGLFCIGLGLPLAYFGALIFPCDYGCPIEGSATQAIYNLMALVHYPLSVIGFAMLAFNLKSRPKWRMACGVVAAAMAIGFVMMITPSQASFRGGWQRLGDYTAFIVLIGLVLSTQPKWKTV